MNLQLNTNFTPACVKHHYVIDGLVNSVARFRPSGDLASVRIGDVTYNSSSLYFHHLKCMTIEARRKLDEELDNDCLELIPQLRATSCS